MPKNSGFNAPTSDPVLIFSFNPTTKFITIQNNDGSNSLRVGFTEASTNVTDGILIKAGVTHTIYLDGETGTLWVLGIVGIIPGVLIRG